MVYHISENNQADWRKKERDSSHKRVSFPFKINSKNTRLRSSVSTNRAHEDYFKAQTREAGSSQEGLGEAVCK